MLFRDDTTYLETLVSRVVAPGKEFQFMTAGTFFLFLNSLTLMVYLSGGFITQLAGNEVSSPLKKGRQTKTTTNNHHERKGFFFSTLTPSTTTHHVVSTKNN